jgi:hypothetical protein
MSKWEKFEILKFFIKLTHIIKQIWWKESDDNNLLATLKKFINLNYENLKL